MSGHAVLEPRVYRAGIAIGEGTAEAVVFDLPGCGTFGPDEVSVRALLPVVVAEHIAWLDQHGDVTRDAFPFEVEIAECVDVASLGATVADGEFCFQDDLRASTRDDVETAIRRMGYARRDLLAVVRHLPDLVLDWQPPAASVKQDDWALGVRSIRGILGHVAGSDSYYAGNVGQEDWRTSSPGESPDLFEHRQQAIDRLRALGERDLGARFMRHHAWQTQGEEHWTVRKALRRFLAHERFHTREIEQRLAWLLVGAPELATANAGIREGAGAAP